MAVAVAVAVAVAEAGAVTATPVARREVASAAVVGAGAGAGAGAEVQREIVERKDRRTARSGTSTVAIASGVNYAVISTLQERGHPLQR